MRRNYTTWSERVQKALDALMDLKTHKRKYKKIKRKTMKTTMSLVGKKAKGTKVGKKRVNKHKKVKGL